MNITKSDLDYRTQLVCKCHKLPTIKTILLKGKTISSEHFKELAMKEDQENKKGEQLKKEGRKYNKKPSFYGFIQYREVCSVTDLVCVTFWCTVSKGGKRKYWNHVDTSSVDTKWILI